MIGSPRGSRDRHRSRTRLTSGVSKIKNVFQPVGDTTKQLPSKLAETRLVATYSCMPGGRITHRTAPRNV
jgi:hypothetical protein